MAKRSTESGGRQNPLPPELSEESKKILRRIARRTGMSYETLVANSVRLLASEEELDRLSKLVEDAGL